MDLCLGRALVVLQFSCNGPGQPEKERGSHSSYGAQSLARTEADDGGLYLENVTELFEYIERNTTSFARLVKRIV